MIGTLAELRHIDRDFELENHGSIYLLRPVTPDASRWISDNVQDPQYWGSAIVVEPRYIATLIAGLHAECFIVEGN